MQIMLETVTWLRNVIAKPSKVTPNPLPEIQDTPQRTIQKPDEQISNNRIQD